MREKMEPLLLLCSILTIQIVLLQSAQGFVASFTTNYTLNKLAVDTTSGKVYIGAKNQLYQLDSSLKLNVTDETGPVMDNPLCISITQSNTCEANSVEQKKLTDNVNKILAIDKQHGQLITCGSIYQGICQVRRLSDITKYKQYDTSLVYRIATNNATMSTVAFVAPGPPDPSQTDVLYVATSYTGIPEYDVRIGIKAVSSRVLMGENTLKFVNNNDIQGTGTFTTMFKPYRKTHIVDYVTGFSADGFSYFMTVQQNDSEPNTYLSKILQICESDDIYSSYVEMSITCGDTYNVLQAATLVQPGSSLQQTGAIVLAVFAKSEPNSKVPTSQSAICVYALSDIRHMFSENIKHCYNGYGDYGKPFESKQCSKGGFSVGTKYCGPPDVGNHPLVGTLSVDRDPVFLTNVSRLSAIAATVSLGTYMVAFIGSSQGHIVKVLITTASGAIKGVEFQKITIESGEPINSDLLFDQNQTHLYAMTTHKVVKIPVQECDKLSSCEECHKDPFCGWCLLENRCSTKPNCSNSALPKHWQSYSTDAACAGITRVTPPYSSITNPVPVNLTVPNLPTSQNYRCLFGDIETSATVEGGYVICQPPTTTDITTQPHNSSLDHVPVKLSLQSSETKVSFLQTDFDFYNCSMHESCTACTSASWGCHWCIYKNKCTQNSFCDTEDTFVQHHNSCPHLQDNEMEILLPAGSPKEIMLNGTNLPRSESYKCLVHLSKPPVHVPATRVNSTSVKCKTYKYVYSSSDDHRTVQLQVIWDGNHLIDDIYKTKVTIYKCSELGPDCSRCFSLPNNATTARFQCVWCSPGVCAYSRNCTNTHDKCAGPTITNVTPLTGPLNGGTLLTITGNNLGSSFNQIQNAVKIGGAPCIAIKPKYKISIQIVCRTSEVKEPKNGNVTVAVDQLSTYWPHQFSYQNPEVSSMSPTVGPKSGGTRLTIKGRKLNTGSNLVVLIGNTNCKVIGAVENGEIHCVTPAVDVPLHTSVRVKFDYATKSLNSNFTFTEDPNITSIHPLTTFQAGGRTVTVDGVYFTSIQQPQMFIREEEKISNLTNCAIISADVIKCPFPALPPGDHRKRRNTANSQPTVGFVMDGVQSVANILAYFPDVASNIKVVANPVYKRFKDGRKVYKGEALVLQGENLSAASEPSDVNVTIGLSPCKVKSLTHDSLLCTPPDKQPPGVEDVTNLPVVVVHVGNLEYELGELEYQKPSDKQGNELWIIGVALGGGFLIAVIIIILVIYKRKSTYSERQFKKMQIQLDTLESNVRNECKQAFAELQTEVSDFTSDLSAKGVPFWDYRTYTFKVLFPSYNDHPILHSTPPSVTTTFGGTDQALGQFNQLLNSKQFLLIFIRTLEDQKNFMIRDKALVASLLMVVLQDKMEYATDILKALLNELIDRSVEKKNPKLMFRRTESVVEKLLTNWMSLCMYDYLKKHAGKTMFMLYKSIKHQTEKGPVDAITSEAKYSLSEDRLLREKIDFNTLNLELTTESCREPVLCKVLDCDTITQAKEKSLDAIYRNTPFSVRPSIYDVELEWRSGRSGHLPLQDEDVTTEIKHKMKHVNTLAHYHIPDYSEMTLVRKPDKNEGVRKVHGRLEITSGLALNAVVEVEDGVKVWHLMKHDDNSNASHGPKVISEIFLTRLLATKGTLQQFIDDLFMTILRADCTLPPAVKHLFDFLDNAIKRHNIVDPEVIHTWKSNSLPLRFWVNIIKNPEFVFDIHKSNIVDSCLSVIAQTFMDSCSTVEHRLGKDSPSNKLLFAKDIPRYRQWVSQFYRNIQEMLPITDQEMSTAMMELSMNNRLDFNVSVALRELFQYAKQYSFELLEALDDDSSGKKLRLATRFEEVLITSGEQPDY